MGLESGGIREVMVFELPAGVWASGQRQSFGKAVLVRWKSDWLDKFYQVYVNGRLAAVTADEGVRQQIVFLPNLFGGSVRIEVFAVEAAEADIDFGSEFLSSRGDSGRVKISLLRSHKLAAGARAEFYFDGGSGQIDFSEALTGEPVEVWEDWREGCGFGMSRFGESDFGRDWSAAAGFGAGCFGLGQFGADEDLFEWVSGVLAAGVYKFAVKIVDEKGQKSAASETSEVVVMPSAKGAEGLEVISFDGSENRLKLGINGVSHP